MGGLVSSLAFPVPKLPQSFYHDLLKRRDLVWLETKKGERIPAIHIQAPLRRRRNVTLLFSHGNAEDIALHLPFVTALAHRTGADVFSYEYVGYGPSRFKDCVPSERGCYRAINAAWAYLIAHGVDPTTIVIYGRSIGTGPSVDLASRVEAKGLILQSPIDSAIRCALGYGSSLALRPIDIFVNYEKMAKVSSRVFIMHGTDDDVVPLRCGRALQKLARHSTDPAWIPGYGHNDIPHDTVFHHVGVFLDALAGGDGLSLRPGGLFSS